MRTILILLILTGFVRWLITGATAYEGPGLDLVPFFERLKDPNFLPTDYFTNAAMQPHPKQVWGSFVTTLASAFGQDWYFSFFLLKSLLSFGFPVLWFFTITRWTQLIRKEEISLTFQWVLAGLIAFIALNPFPAKFSPITLFSVAWWKPYSDFVAPHSIGLILALLGVVLFDRTTSKIALSSLLFLLASLVHPAMSLMVVLVHSVILLFSTMQPFKKFATLAAITTAWILPGIWYTLKYKTTHPISLKEYTYIYAQLAHSSHYDPLNFGGFAGVPWWLSFLFTLLLLLTGAFASRRIISKTYQQVGLTLATLYIGALTAQFVAVYYPFSKLLAALGPARFFVLGYWLNVIVWTPLLARSIENATNKFNSPYCFQRYLATLLNYAERRRALPALLFATLTVTSLLRYSSSYHEATKEIANNSKIIQWIALNTQSDDIILVPFGDLPWIIPRVAKRGVVAGIGFPFSEDYFLEYKSRESMVFGSLEERLQLGGRWIGESMANFYRNLNPTDILTIARKFRADYVIIENSHIYAEQFGKPKLAADGYKIFRISEMSAQSKT